MVRLALPVLVAGSLVLAACGSNSPAARRSTTTTAGLRASTSTSLTTTTVSAAVVGQKVLAIIKASNDQIQANKALPDSQWPTADAQAFQSAAEQLQALTYPPDAQADAKALVAILEKLAYDSSSLATDAQNENAVGAESDATATTNDEGTELADSDALRHDLGLPPASLSTSS